MYRMGVSESKTVIVVCTLQQTLVSVSFCTRKCDVIEWAKLGSRPAPPQGGYSGILVMGRCEALF